MLLVTVERDLIAAFDDVSVNSGSCEALLFYLFDDLLVSAFLLADDRRQDVELLGFEPGDDVIGDLIRVWPVISLWHFGQWMTPMRANNRRR